MKSIALIILLIFVSIESFADTKCNLDKKTPADRDNRSLYVCKVGKKVFKARCDGSTDAEYKTPPVESAVWKKYSKNEGIEFKGGFVVCKKT